jgi:hypothetical protein
MLTIKIVSQGIDYFELFQWSSCPLWSYRGSLGYSMTKIILLFFILYSHSSLPHNKLTEVFSSEIPAKITYKTYNDTIDKTKKYYQIEEIVAAGDNEVNKIFDYCYRYVRSKYRKDPTGYWYLLNDRSEDKFFALFYFLYRVHICRI